MRNQTTDGFTLVELLAAIVIMGLLITAVLAPLTSLFRQTATSTQTLQATTQAQGALETIRGQWRSPPTPSSPDQSIRTVNDAARNTVRAAYDRTCYTLPTAPSGVSVVVTVQALNRSGSVGASQTRNCGGSAPAASAVPVMKRVTVTTTVANRTQATLSVDIPRPPANDPQQITN